MTTKEFLKLEGRLLASFPSFRIKDRVMFVVPVDHNLRGFHFDPSGFSAKRFYVNMFFMPLYVPARHLHFTFGHRVGHMWDAEEKHLDGNLTSAMQKDVPFLLRLRTPMDVADALRPLTTRDPATGYINPHCYEALAYSLVRAEKTGAALKVIGKILNSANPTVEWETEIRSRARLISELLRQNLELALKQLSAWELETIRSLGLEDIESPDPKSVLGAEP